MTRNRPTILICGLPQEYPDRRLKKLTGLAVTGVRPSLCPHHRKQATHCSPCSSRGTHPSSLFQTGSGSLALTHCWKYQNQRGPQDAETGNVRWENSETWVGLGLLFTTTYYDPGTSTYSKQLFCLCACGADFFWTIIIGSMHGRNTPVKRKRKETYATMMYDRILLYYCCLSYCLCVCLM